jgi:hypothetical protein
MASQKSMNMNQVGNFINTNITLLAFVLAVVTIFLSVVALLISRRPSSRNKNRESSEPQSEFEKILDIPAIEAALEDSKKTATWAQRSDLFLFIGQTVLGAAITSTFGLSQVQQLDKNLTGFLGLLVLIASLIRTEFLPKVKYIESRQKITDLTFLKRTAESGLFAIKNKSPNAPDQGVFLNEIAAQFRQIQNYHILKTEGKDKPDIPPKGT